MTVRNGFFFQLIIQLFIALGIILIIPQSVFAQVRINEVSVHSDTEWVEFYNENQNAEYIKSFFIDDDEAFTDDDGSGPKKPLSSLNTSSTMFPFIEITNSIFNNNVGGTVVLFNGDGKIIDKYVYDDDPGENISLGNYPDNTGSFYILSSQTKGSSNSAPQSSPSPIPTPTATPKVTPTATPKPTPTPTPQPTSTPKPSVSPTPSPRKSSPSPTSKLSSPSPEPSDDVLGATDEAVPTSSPVEATRSSQMNVPNNLPFGFLLITFGILLSGGAGFLAYKKQHQVNSPS